MNCTISQYVRRVKLEHAKELLETTNMKIWQIASELHFETTNHFNHLFKKQFNVTPFQYRKARRASSTVKK